MCENIHLFCGLCRVGSYALYRRVCCKGSPPTRPNLNVLCLGLSGAGKSSLLALISGDDLHSIPPTIGFSIKALMFDDCVLDVKELGGGEKVRPYWDRYYEGSQGIIYVVDSGSSDEDFSLTKTELHNALANPALNRLPLLVLANHQDVEGAKTEAEIQQILELDGETNKRIWMINGCSITNKEQVEAALSTFCRVLLGGKVTATDNRAPEISRI